jgi:PAS domain S-box-containing protein
VKTVTLQSNPKTFLFLDEYIDLFEALPGLYLILLPDLTIVQASDAYLSATLTKREEIVGRNLFDVFPDNPEDFSATGELNLSSSLKHVLKLKKEHKMALQRYDVRQPNGSFVEKYWQPLNRPVLNSKKEIVFIIHTVEDVTPFVTAEHERIKHEKENLKMMKDLSDIKYAIDQSANVAITDSKGIIQIANENFCNTTGYLAEELIGSSHIIVNSGFHPKSFFKEMWRTISSGKVWKGQIKNRAKGGKEYWVQKTITPFLNEFGKPYQYLAISTNITEQKVAVEQLKRTSEMFSSLFENNPAFILISKLDDAKIVNVNKAFLAAFGFSNKKQVLGKTANELNIVADPKQREELALLLKENEMVKDFEIRTFDKTGNPFWVSTSILILDIDNVPCLFSISVDISNRKKAEEQLLAVNKELESFSYSVSHDLRAPLRAINGYTNILVEDHSDKLDKEGKRMLNVVIESANMMGKLIDELLSFSRIGKQNVMKVEFNMLPIVQTVVTDQMDLYPIPNMMIKIGELNNVFGDSSMIRLVMTNLISNAFKYSSKKEKPLIEIGSRTENNETIFYVKDNGAGFDMKYYDKLFGVFQRLHSAVEFEGTGVGLAIVNRIITKHEGKIWAESKLNEGTTFYFSLPGTKTI